MEIYIPVKIPAHTNRRTLILAYSVYEAQKVSTSVLVLIKVKVFWCQKHINEENDNSHLLKMLPMQWHYISHK